MKKIFNVLLWAMCVTKPLLAQADALGDFIEKITPQDIRNILQEVCLTGSGLNELVNELNQVLLSEA